MSLGALGYVGYGPESTEGTAVAPTKFIPVSSFSFEDSNDFIIPDQVRASRDRLIAMAAPYATSGSMEMELIPVSIGNLLKSAFAATINTSAYTGGGYEHTFTPGSTSPYLTFEGSAADILVMRYGGVRVNTLDIRGAFGEIVTASFGLEGTTRAKQGSASSPSYQDVKPFHFTGALLKINSGTAWNNVKDFTFTVNNNLTRIGTLRKTRSYSSTRMGFRDVSLTATLDFQDTNDYDRFLNETEFDVEIYLESDALGNFSLPNAYQSMGTNPSLLKINIPKVKWNRVGVPITANDYLEQSVEAMILKPNASAIFTAILRNNELSATLTS